jgi:hypothetical protein
VNPTVGVPELTQPRGSCGYSLKPGTRRCGAGAVIHLLVHNDTWGLVALSSCETHAAYARATEGLLAVHRFASGCTHPQSRWSTFPHDETLSECVAPAGAAT